MIMTKMMIPMIKRSFPELSSYDLCSAQPTGPTALKFDWISYNFPCWKSNWIDYRISDKQFDIDGYDGWTVYEVSFESIERQNREENEYKIGKTVTRISNKGNETVEVLTKENCHWLIDNKKYQEFKSFFQEGDNIVYFRSPQNSWFVLAGREGFSIIRDNKIVKTYITLMS